MGKDFSNSKEMLERLNQHLNEVRENERAVLARELHDELGQSLTAINFNLNRLQYYVTGNPEAGKILTNTISLISGTIKDVQRISTNLRPGILDDLGFVAAVEWYCDQFEKRTGIKCSLNLDNPGSNNSKKDLTFFRILQETLTNVIRHSKASLVVVSLHKSNAGTIMTIHDNGKGIPRKKIGSHESIGLRNMTERVRQLNGTIEFSSRKGDGTRVTVCLPEI
jgi:signal transduction histidine kinase